MKLWIGRIGIGMMLVFAGWFMGTHFGVVHAQNIQTAPFIVPAGAGHCVGSIIHAGADGVIFEAEDGTIRIVNVANGNTIIIPRH